MCCVFSLESVPRSRVARPEGACVFTCFSNADLFSRVVIHIYIPTRNMRVLHCFISSSAHGTVRLSQKAPYGLHLMAYYVTDGETEYLVSEKSCITFLGSACLKSFVHFSVWSGSLFFHLTCRNSLL